ncbi:unnamed protein product [Ceratitis capitata]|uniref:(Mediterranean fruit fly) hypothetical protein n=1 Tax=Ceratitis capitata TaxID=7213 RepID=A0A811V6Q1_CERCA|nr:unnamed protein product [Ceratitis capitata]
MALQAAIDSTNTGDSQLQGVTLSGANLEVTDSSSSSSNKAYISVELLLGAVGKVRAKRCHASRFISNK